LISSDEELNVLYVGLEVAYLEGSDKYCIYGLDGTELEVDDEDEPEDGDDAEVGDEVEEGDPATG
jgi:hypothetical protein